MKTYTVLYAEDVPHYATVLIEADNDQTATAAAKKYDFAEEAREADWDNPVCRRIVHIEDEEGGTVVSDIPLDNYRLHNIAETTPQGYTIGINRGDDDTHGSVIKQNDKPIATLIATEGEVAPLLLAGNCHEGLVNSARQALRELREFYLDRDSQAIIELKSALEKAGAA